MAQQVTGRPGSPDATTTIDGRYLPPPPPEFKGEISPNAADIISVVGQSLGRSQGIATFAWDFLVPADEELLPWFLAYIATDPYGWVLQAGAVSGVLGAPGGGFGSFPRNNGKGKKRGNPKR